MNLKLELLEIIEQQKQLLDSKEKLIEKLTIDNLEKENIIALLSNKEGDDVDV